MDKVAQYFTALGQGQNLTDLEEFQQNIRTVARHYPPSSMMRQFWFASRAASRLPNVNPAATSRVTRDANDFLYKETRGLETAIDDPAVTIEDLEKLLSIYARLQTTPLSSMTEKIIHKTRQSLSVASPETLARLPFHFVNLGVYPGDQWMETWWDATVPTTGKWSLNEGYTTLYHITLLDFLRSEGGQANKPIPSPCRKIADSFLDVIEKNARFFFDATINGQVFYAAKWFARDFIDRFQLQTETSRSSRAEQIFPQAFSRTNIVVKSEGIIVPQTGHKIDFELVNGKSHGAELDGVIHFNRVSQVHPRDKAVSFNTSTRFQSWLLTELCPELHILRVPYFYCDGAQRNQPWEDVLDRLGRSKPGVYAYHGVRDIINMTERGGCLFKGQAL